MIAIFGGGDIANHGILPVVGGVIIPKYECDVRNYGEVSATMQKYNPQIVINCAGVSHVSTIKKAYISDWQEEIETNLIGGFHIAKAAINYKVKTQIHIASLAGLYGKPNHSGYSASKSGLISLVQSLSFEGHNAYAISPGRVDTKMREKDYPGEDKRTRLAPIKIGEIIKEILSDKYQSGDNIIIRMQGFDILPIIADKGEPWRTDLKIGLPPTC